MIRVCVTAEPVDLAAEMAAAGGGGAGAIATFTGLVRADGHVQELTLEHYPGMTEAALEGIARAALERWSLQGVTIVHRVGAMRVGENIVFVATTASHRAAALEACAYCIDRLKTDAPFWKRELRGDEARWIEARAADEADARRWDRD